MHKKQHWWKKGVGQTLYRQSIITQPKPLQRINKNLFHDLFLHYERSIESILQIKDDMDWPSFSCPCDVYLT